MTKLDIDKLKNMILGALVIQSAMLKLAGVNQIYQVSTSLIVQFQICTSMLLMLVTASVVEKKVSKNSDWIYHIFKALVVIALTHTGLLLYIFSHESLLNIFLLTVSIPVIALPANIWLASSNRPGTAIR